MILVALVALLPVAGCSGSSSSAPASTPVSVPASWPQISLAPVASGFTRPVHVTHAGDRSGRVFLVEQSGRIRILDNGVVLPTPFLDIASRVASVNEQGLLSVAFPPGYPDKRYFYVYYTPVPGDNTVVARYRVTADNNIADSTSETIVLRVPQPFGNHNGGQLAFGPDGYLYIGKGDGGGANDQLNSGQRTNTLLGKILRIDVESGAATYAIPADNPFRGVAGGEEIWALGLRNPWRFSFDRVTGDLYIADVGQNAYEEVDFQPAGDPGGHNYGWNIMEGMNCFINPACSTAGLTLPVFVYDHSLGCSVTGGHVYRGSAFPTLQGVYLFGDYCSGRIWGLRKNGPGWDNALLLDSALKISSFGEDEEGNVYVADHTGGEILKIVVP